jgi:opacity protein-like surface antigen
MKLNMKAIFFVGILSVCLLTGLATVPAAQAQESAETANKWQFEITPYFLAAAMNGTNGVGGVSVDIDMGFDDIWNNLDAGLMGMFEARKGPWTFAFDAVYFRLKDEQTKSWTGPAGNVTVKGDVEATMTQQLYTGWVGYRLMDNNTKLDLTGGVRHTIVENEFNIVLNSSGNLFPGGTRNLEGRQSWSDPIIGARVATPFSKKWSVYGYGDIGGFGVGSDITYQLLGGIRWQISKIVSAKLAYRYLYQDYEDDGFIWDMSYHGPMLGVGFTF